MKISGIYIILNTINNKWYVGSSEDIITPNVGRWYHHKYMLKNNRHNNEHLQNAYNKYGDMFEYHIVELVLPERLLEAEQKYLDYAENNKNQVYNRTFIAGKIEMTEATRKKIGEKSKERLKNKENHPMFGKKHSEETRKKLSEKTKLQWKNGNVRIVAPRYGIDSPNYGRGEKIRGKLHYHYNHMIYNFYNVITGELFSGTRYEFYHQFNLNKSIPNDLVRKWIKQSRTGWILKD
jgi:group I intron endonuclease